MLFSCLLDRPTSRPNSHRSRRAPHGRSTYRLAAELLEDRLTPAALLTIGDATIVEGNTGVQNVLVNVHLTEPHGNSVTVNYSTIDGSATAGSDYIAVSGNLTFAKNVMNKSIPIQIRGDRALEWNEYFSVRLSNAKGAKIADNTGNVTIMDDEPSISIGDASLGEGDAGTTTMQFPVYLSHSYDIAVTVNYATRNDSATAPSDYVAKTGSLTFGPNDSTPKMITIDVIDDQLAELSESFLVDVTSSVTVSRGTAVGTIWDNEPRISISDASLVEGDAGNTLMQFEVSISNAYGLPVTVNYTTIEEDSATAGSDYVGESGMLTFGPNDSSPKMITIEVIGDEMAEPDEFFFVDVTTPDSHAEISRGTAVGTIWDDEPRISISDAYNYGESTITFTVSVSNLDDGEMVTVDFATVDYSAIGGDPYADPNAYWDYVTTWGTLDFDSTNTTQMITIEVNTGTFYYDKFFYVQLTNASPNALIAYEWGAGYAYNGYYYYDPGCCYDPWYGYY